MRTAKQIEASRMNGKKSRGPTTPMGKDRIRSNALKHGLTARLTVWKNEDPRQFHALLLAMLEEFAPTNDVQFLCVEEMAMAKWRQRRVANLELTAGNKYLNETELKGGEATLAAFSAAQKSAELMTTIRQHEAAHARAYQRAYRHFLSLREREAERCEPVWTSELTPEVTQ